MTAALTPGGNCSLTGDPAELRCRSGWKVRALQDGVFARLARGSVWRLDCKLKGKT